MEAIWRQPTRHIAAVKLRSAGPAHLAGRRVLQSHRAAHRREKAAERRGACWGWPPPPPFALRLLSRPRRKPE